MFDVHSHNYTQVTEEVTKNVNIKEYRAPTDESLKLLTEMEEKIKSRILATGSISNFFNAEFMVERLYDSQMCLVYVLFNLNYVEHKFSFKLPSPLLIQDENLFIEVIETKVIQKLSELILPQLTTKLRLR